MIRLRNLERLYPIARSRIEVLEKANKEAQAKIKELEGVILAQGKIIEDLKLQLEELKQKVYGKGKKKDKDKDDDQLKSSLKGEGKERDKSSYQREEPKAEAVTRTEGHTLGDCPQCGSSLTKSQVIVFYQEDIVLNTGENEPLKEVVKHEVEKGYCEHCQKWFSAVKLPNSKVILGPKVKLYVCYLAILIRLSFEQIRHLLISSFNFPISDGEIAKILAKEAITLHPEYENIKQRILDQKAVHVDEFPWPVQKEEQGHYGWVIIGTKNEDRLVVLGRSRGKGNLEELLENRTDLIGITDNYGAYKNSFSLHQLCWAHPHRKFKDLAFSDKLKKPVKKHCQKVFLSFHQLYFDLSSILKETFHLPTRLKQQEELEKRFLKIAGPQAKDPAKITRIKDSLLKDRDHYFTCLTLPGIPADNNKAERAIRHLVLKRKICFGSKTQTGAHSVAVLASVLLSLFAHHPANFFSAYLSLKQKL